MSPKDIIVGPWGARFLGRQFPVALGRGGITHTKREGDGATPVGVHRIMGCLWRADRLAKPCDWAVPIGPSDLWSDDVGDPDYNHLVRAPHVFSHERLTRGNQLYDVVLITDWNWPKATPGKGSAIFVHNWRGPRLPTAGCVAFQSDHLLWIVARACLGTRLIVKS